MGGADGDKGGGADGDDASDPGCHNSGGIDGGGFNNGVIMWYAGVTKLSSGKCIMEGWLCDQEHDCRYHRNSQNHHHNDDFDASV